MELVNTAYQLKIKRIELKKWQNFYMNNFFPDNVSELEELKVHIENSIFTFIKSFTQVGFLDCEHKYQGNLKEVIIINGLLVNLSTALNEKMENMKEEDPGNYSTFMKMRKLLEEEELD